MCSKVTLIIGQGQQDRACSSEICLVCVFLVVFFFVSPIWFTCMCSPACAIPTVLPSLWHCWIQRQALYLGGWLPVHLIRGWRIWLQAVLSLASELCTCLRCSVHPVWTHNSPLPRLLAACLLWIKRRLANVRKSLHSVKRRKKRKEW